MVASTKGSRQWKPGDYCLARYWEDKQVFFNFTISPLSPPPGNVSRQQ